MTYRNLHTYILKYYLNINKLSLLKELSIFSETITYNQFIQVINKVGIPYHSINALNLKILYCDFGGSETINQKDFLSSIEMCVPFSLENSSYSKNPSGINYESFKSIVQPAEKLICLFRVLLGNKDNLLRDLIDSYGLTVTKPQLLDYFRPKCIMFRDLLEEFVYSIDFNKQESFPTYLVGRMIFSKNQKDSHTKMLEKIEKAVRRRKILDNLTWRIIKVYGHQELDFDNDGLISFDDIVSSLHKYNINASTEDLQKIFVEYQPVKVKAFQKVVEEVSRRFNTTQAFNTRQSGRFKLNRSLTRSTFSGLF